MYDINVIDIPRAMKKNIWFQENVFGPRLTNLSYPTYPSLISLNIKLSPYVLPLKPNKIASHRLYFYPSAVLLAFVKITEWKISGTI